MDFPVDEDNVVSDANNINDDVDVSEENTEENTEENIEEDKFETRTFKDERSYKVLVIDSPEKWKNADEFKFDKVVKKGECDVLVIIKCISYATNEFANENYQIPEEDDKNKGLDDTIETIKAIRKALFFEAALGVTLKGSNFEEKANSIMKLPAVYIDRLFEIINRDACGLAEGNLPEYYKKSAMSGESVAKKISNEDLFDFSNEEEAVMFCRIQRPFEKHIIEFPLRQISAEDRNRIERDNPIPDPPSRPGEGFDTTNPVPFPEEPAYKARIARIKIKKTIQYIEACLIFDIPGDTSKEKYEWISRKVCGDVYKLQLFIQNEIIDYSWGISFF